MSGSSPRGPVQLWCHYVTVPGQRVQVITGGRVSDLAWAGDGWWSGTVTIDSPYHYRLVDDTSVLVDEQGPLHELPPGLEGDAVVVDRWQDQDPVRPVRRSSLFARALAARHEPDESPPATATGFRFRLLEPDVPGGWRPAVVGEGPELGSWRPDRARPMRPAAVDGYPWWEADVAATPEGRAYKYVLLGPDGEVDWEAGDDRRLPPCPDRPAVVVDESLRGRPGWRGAGVVVPVFALRGEHSLGVGQFTDLPAFVDWAAAAGMSVVQLLPINDTITAHDWDDSYPYDVVSVHALHPLYVDLLDLPGADVIADDVASARADLEHRDEIAYEEVMDVKWRLLRRVYDVRASTEEFERFVEAEWDWLGPYALWCLLRDRHGTADPRRWGDDGEFSHERLTAVARPSHPDHDELSFHAWVQWHLRRQLTAAARHARDRGVALKGDLPIGVSPTSVETWVHPELFHAGTQTGAPPDEFSDDGQNWGFPTYDWKRMAADDHRWWRRRFDDLARTFDAYRIDHVLGFFRIWEIPHGASSPLLGRFRPCLPLPDAEVRGWLGDVDLRRLTVPVDESADVALLPVDGGWHPRIAWRRTSAYRQLPAWQRDAFDAMATDFFHVRHDRLWRGRGRDALTAVVGATDLLACGEDLGMVPPLVPELMREFGLLSLEIERMPKQLGAWRTDPAATPYLSVLSTGTHDMPVLRAWWRDDRDGADRLWREALGGVGAAPLDLPPPVAERIVAHQLASPAMLCILPIQDYLAIDSELRRENPDAETVNVPADRHHRWRYRLHLSTADLAAATAFTERVRSLVVTGGRYV